MKTTLKNDAGYDLLSLGTKLVRGDEFKRKRNKIWTGVFLSHIGRPITKRYISLGFEFRRKVK